MKKRNFVKQEGFKDCGPACLAMIINHYQGYMEFDDLKELCQTDKTGTTAYHLITAAKEIGFEAYGIKCKLDDMNKENMILPCIAHVIIDKTYNHYVVVSKINYKRKTIIIKDPMGNIKKLTFKEFSNIYNDILICLYPIKPIICDQVKTIKGFILNNIQSSKKQLKEIIIISFIITLLAIISSFYFQMIIDNISYGKNKIILILICFIIVNSFKTIADFFRNKILIIVNQKINLELTNKTFKNIILLPYSYYRNNTTGEIISKIGDLDIVKDVISKVAISLFIDLPLAVITLLVLYFLNKTLWFISLLIIILYFLVFLIFKGILISNIKKYHHKKAITTSYMVESINGFESVKGTNMTNKIVNNFQFKQIDLLKSIFKFDSDYNLECFFKELINSFGFLIIIAVGAIQIVNEQFTIGGLISFNMLLNYFLTPIKNIVDLNHNFYQAKNAIKRVINLFYKEKEKASFDKSMIGDIEFKNLEFSFKDNNVFKNVNFKIKQSNKVMVIGQSGLGKSTLFKILKKYFEVKRGMVVINGIDINDYEKSDIIYISQNEFLFTDTILNNIGGFSKGIKICLIDDIIKQNSLGYNMLLEENGFNISGGEAQRIILARAIYNPFNILIIDEGLSQVDINMERKILKNLFKEYKDKTIIVISHRYDNMDLFDQVIKIEEGNVSSVQKNKS